MLAFTRYTIETLKIVANGNEYDITIDQLNSLSLSESIMSIGFEGNISFLDYYNYQETIPILGGEKLQIVIIDEFKKKLKLDFVIVKKQTSNKTDAVFTSDVVMYIKQKELLDFESKNYYKSTNKETVNDIIKDMMTNFGYSSMFSENTKVVQNRTKNIVFPNTVSCDKCIRYLLDKNAYSGNYSLYFYYDKNTQKFIIKSQTELETSEQRDNDILSFTSIERESINFIRNMTVQPQRETSELLETYIGSNVIYSADLDKKKVHIKETDMKDYMTETNTKYLAISKDSYSYDYNTKYYVYSPFLYSGQQYSELNSNRASFFRGALQCTIDIAGRLDLYLGDKISLKYQEQTNNSTNKLFQGDWIVGSIVHNFSSAGEYSQKVSLLKSSITPINKNNTNILSQS